MHQQVWTAASEVNQTPTLALSRESQTIHHRAPFLNILWETVNTCWLGGQIHEPSCTPWYVKSWSSVPQLGRKPHCSFWISISFWLLAKFFSPVSWCRPSLGYWVLWFPCSCKTFSCPPVLLYPKILHIPNHHAVLRRHANWVSPTTSRGTRGWCHPHSNLPQKTLINTSVILNWVIDGSSSESQASASTMEGFSLGLRSSSMYSFHNLKLSSVEGNSSPPALLRVLAEHCSTLLRH